MLPTRVGRLCVQLSEGGIQDARKHSCGIKVTLLLEQSPLTSQTLYPHSPVPDKVLGVNSTILFHIEQVPEEELSIDKLPGLMAAEPAVSFSKTSKKPVPPAGIFTPISVTVNGGIRLD